MAINELYKNKLRKKNADLQTSSLSGNTSSQASTYDGEGHGSIGVNTLQTLDRNGIVQNQGNGLVGSNSTQSNTTNQSTWVDSLRNAGQSIGNKVNNVANNFFNALQTYVDNNKTAASVNSNPTWKDYADLINAKTANSKVELQTAMQRAQSASNDYLKALGLQGSGFGQSQLTDIGAQYQNALSNANRQAESDVNAQLDNDFREMVDNGASSQDIENYIKQYGEQTGLTNSWNNYVQQSGADFDSSVKNVMKDLTDMQNNDSYESANGIQMKLNDEQKQYAAYVQRMIDEAMTTGNRDEIKQVLEKYNKFLTNPESLTDKDIYHKDMYMLNKYFASDKIDPVGTIYVNNRGYKYENGQWKRV